MLNNCNPITASILGGVCGAMSSLLFQKACLGFLTSVLVPIPTFAPLIASALPLWGSHVYLEKQYGPKSGLTLFNTAMAVGIVTGCGIAEIAKCGQHLPFGIFACALGFYHFAEFALVARYNPSLLSVDSFLGGRSLLSMLCLWCA